MDLENIMLSKISQTKKILYDITYVLVSFLSLNGKESACNVGDLGSIPKSGRPSGEGNGNPLQDSRLEKSMDREAWGLQSMGVTKSDTTE